jgi:bacillithiol system protein YtxJ
MKWNQLKAADQLDEIKQESTEKTILIFKHSTRCNISRASLDRLERKWNDSEMQNVKPYFLDLLNFREISNLISQQFNVEHESPQILLINQGQVILDQSHFSIDYDQIKAVAKN